MRWYGPNNAYLVLLGMSIQKKYYYYLKNILAQLIGQEVRNLRLPKVNLPQNKYRKFADRIYFPMAGFVYPTIPNFHKDEPHFRCLS